MQRPSPGAAEFQAVSDEGSPKCDLCGSWEVRALWQVTDKKFGGPGRFTYWRCAGCGLVALHPRPGEEDLAEYYPDHVTPVEPPGRFRQRLKRMVAEDWYGYGADRPTVIGLLRKAATFPLRRLLGQVPTKRQDGRVLDIGCGSGGYLAFLASLGWMCHGVEPGPNSRGYAQRALGLAVHPGPLKACRFPDQRFDVVTMWHVIEHLADPLETLREIHRVLKRDGIVLLRTPNVESWEARVFQGCWYGVDAPRHVYLFSLQTLGAFLAKAGFVITDVRYQYHAVDCSRSCLYALEDAGWTRARRFLAGWMRLFELLLAACSPLRRALGRGGAMQVMARKGSA